MWMFAGDELCVPFSHCNPFPACWKWQPCRTICLTTAVLKCLSWSGVTFLGRMAIQQGSLQWVASTELSGNGCVSSTGLLVFLRVAHEQRAISGSCHHGLVHIPWWYFFLHLAGLRVASWGVLLVSVCVFFWYLSCIPSRIKFTFGSDPSAISILSLWFFSQ